MLSSRSARRHSAWSASSVNSTAQSRSCSMTSGSMVIFDRVRQRFACSRKELASLISSSLMRVGKEKLQCRLAISLFSDDHGRRSICPFFQRLLILRVPLTITDFPQIRDGEPNSASAPRCQPATHPDVSCCPDKRRLFIRATSTISASGSRKSQFLKDERLTLV
jgi:hypothetical protein